MLETIKILRELTLNLTKADDDGCNHSSYFVSSNLYPTLLRIMLIINIMFRRITKSIAWKSSLMKLKVFDLKTSKHCAQPHCNHLRVQDLSKSPIFMTLLCQHFMHTCNLVLMLAWEKCLHGSIMLNCFIYEHDC